MGCEVSIAPSSSCLDLVNCRYTNNLTDEIQGAYQTAFPSASV